MRLRRNLFVQPSDRGSPVGKGSNEHPPLGIGYVAEPWRRAGVPSGTLDLGLGHALEQAARAAEEFERVPPFAAPGMSLLERQQVLEWAEQTRRTIQERARRCDGRARSRVRFARYDLPGRVFAAPYVSPPACVARRPAHAESAGG